MKNTVLLASFLMICSNGCGPSVDDVRRMVHEELSKAREKTVIAPTRTIGPYSPAVKVGDFLFLSGQIGIDQATGILKNQSIESETQQTLHNIMSLLRSAGYDSSHVVSSTVFLKNMNDFEKMNTVYARFFPGTSYPARTTVAVSELPRQANIEITVVAYRHDRQ